MISNLAIKATRNDKSCVLWLKGVVNSYSCIELMQELARSNPKPGNTVALNLAGVEYIDTASMSSLVMLAEQAKKSSVNLILACLRKDVARVLRLSGVLRLFPVVNAAEFSSRFQSGDV